MGLFGNLFSSSKKKEIRDEINLMEAAQAHIGWKMRLQQYLDGTSGENLDPEVVCRDDQCKLGVWIYGSARNHFGDEEAFHALTADHAVFHQLAGKIVSYAQVSKFDEAHALMEGEYKRVSRKVVMALTELNGELVA